MEEIQRLYNSLTEGINNTEDLILRMNDVIATFLLLVTKSLEVETDQKKRSMIIDSVKPMVNNLVTTVMKVVTEAEMKTIEDDK